MPMQHNFQDLTGRRFNRLAVVSQAPKKNGRVQWHCRCNCGRHIDANADNLKAGRTQSCGCLQKEFRAAIHTTHGAWVGGDESPTHVSWRMMIGRCHNPKNNRFKHYGARGIKVCAQWRFSFEEFLTDMGERPTNTTIERKNNSKGYTPSNCRWATQREQQNHRRNNCVVHHEGTSLTVAEWSRATGIKAGTLYARFAAGWEPARALTP
jgi:hypothetical protein